MVELLDRRLHAYREDLADIALKGRVEAANFVAGRPFVVRAPVVDLKPRPSRGSGTDTQLLMGDLVQVFEQRDGWAWLQAERDGYVGYAPTNCIGFRAEPATHHVVVPRTFLYREPDLKTPPVCVLSMGASFAVIGSKETRNTLYAQLAGGRYAVASHVAPLAEMQPDWVSVAAQFLNTPYLWGGVSGEGLDCSGLIALALRMVGQDVPRDSDMQEQGLGEAVDGSNLQRGDCVFWKGHVGIMEDSKTLLHANGHTNFVSREPLAEAVERIAYLYGKPTCYRRVTV